MTKSLQFLSSGGEMGALMRTYDWKSSPVGPADKWPQSLRTTLSILLNSKFPMFLFWGPNLVCFYNDAYRFSLGNDGKHPLILGMKGEEAWPETWHIVKLSIDQVFTEDEATWSEDQFIPPYREGEMKDEYWTFSYSSVKDESDQTAGVLITCIETTEKVNNFKKLEESNDQLSFAIEATQLGTWDFNPLTNKFIGNNRLKDWFGLPHEMEVDLTLAIEVMVEKDRSRVVDVIQKTLQYESGGLYDIEYGIINPVTKQERIIRAKGRAWFGEDKMAYRFNGTLQDITQQAIAIRKIEENEQRFRNLILQAPVLITTFEGLSYKVATINKKALEIWGKTYEQVINKPLFEVSPETEDGLKTIFNNIYSTGEPFIANEYMVQIKRQGKPETAYFNSVYQPLRDIDNKIYGIISIGTEVTESVNARKLLEASAEFNRTVLESSPDCLKVLDKEGRIQFMNFNGLCQMEIDDFSTFKNKNWFTLWGSENEALVKASIDKALTGATAQFTALCTTAKGTPKWWDVVVSPVGKPGEHVQQIISVSRDITEKKKSEESIENMAAYLKLATDSANVGTWSLNVPTQELEWSALHKRIWGYNEQSKDLTYEDWHKAIVPEDKELALQKIEESKVNNSIYEVDYRINRANDGAVVWIKSTGKYQYDEFGVAHTLTGISIDISEQKRIDAELLEAKSKAETDKKIAEHAVISKQQFLSNMSHEIRTPMNAVIGFTTVLMKTDLSEKQKEYLQAIESSGNTLIVLINDILDLAKVDAGKMIFINAPFKISESITTILHLFEPKIQKGNLELVKEYDSRIPEILLGDSVRLHQILINLLSNAIKFTAKGKIIVSVNLLNEDEEKVTLEIKVTDTGIGIPENQIATIFENFEQATNITSSLYGGTGLGLAIVKQLVEKQGGTISVKSKVDKGSTFSFTLSYQKTQTDPDSYLEEDGEMELNNEIKDIKVLVVEDIKLNQLLLRIILDDFKFAWDMADNGKIAIEKLQTNAYDIILMDLQMPIMNGFEATQHIRNKMNLQMPIIALTADVTTVDVEKCKAAGMNDYISKPIDEKLLYSKILDLIKSK